MATLNIMTQQDGHLTVEFTKEDEASLVEAERQFNEYRPTRVPYKTDADGNNPEQINKFDAEAENITLALPLVGG